MKIAILMALGACHYPINPADLPAYVAQAMTEANTAFGAAVFYPGDEVTVRLVKDLGEADILGFTNCRQVGAGSQCEILIVSDITTQAIVPVLLHEMGHSIGLLHSANPDDVMQPDVPITKPTKQLAEALATDCMVHECLRKRSITVAR